MASTKEGTNDINVHQHMPLRDLRLPPVFSMPIGPFLPPEPRWVMRPALYNGRNNLVLFMAAVTFFHRIHVPSIPVSPEVSVSRTTPESSDFLFFFFSTSLLPSRACMFLCLVVQQLPCLRHRTSYHAGCFACQHEWNAYSFGVLARLRVRCLPLPHLHVSNVSTYHHLPYMQVVHDLAD